MYVAVKTARSYVYLLSTIYQRTTDGHTARVYGTAQ